MAIEAMQLFSNFYISITCTQILPLVIRTNQGYSGGWIFGFLFPIICNFLMLQQILSKCVLLRAVYELDADVAGAVCEDTKEERTAVKKMRLSVHQQLKEEVSSTIPHILSNHTLTTHPLNTSCHCSHPLKSHPYIPLSHHTLTSYPLNTS